MAKFEVSHLEEEIAETTTAISVLEVSLKEKRGQLNRYTRALDHLKSSGSKSSACVDEVYTVLKTDNTALSAKEITSSIPGASAARVSAALAKLRADKRVTKVGELRNARYLAA